MNRTTQLDTLDALDTLINVLCVLCEKQWVSTSSYFTPTLSQHLYEEAHQLYTAGHVQPASIGKGSQAQENQDIRQTHIHRTLHKVRHWSTKCLRPKEPDMLLLVG